MDLVDIDNQTVHQKRKCWLPETTPVNVLKKLLDVQVVEIKKSDSETFGMIFCFVLFCLTLQNENIRKHQNQNTNRPIRRVQHNG